MSEHLRVLAALKKVLAGDVIPFKRPDKVEDKNDKSKRLSLIIDWNDVELYPVRGTNIKLLSVPLKGAGPGNRLVLSLIPKFTDLSKTIHFQLDEVGGEFCRTLEEMPLAQAEQYIKSKLLKDVEDAYSTKVGNLKVTQKIPSNFSSRLDEIVGG